MLYKNAKKILSKAFNSTTDLAKVARKGYELNISEASTQMEKHMVESAQNLIKEGKISGQAINNGLLKLTGKEALKARYSDSSVMKNPLLDDMLEVGKVAAAGIIGLRATQSAISLASGDL